MRLSKYGKGPLIEWRPLTEAEARGLSYGDTVWFLALGGFARSAKVNGEPKTWKRKFPRRVVVPLKYGLYEYFRAEIFESEWVGVVLIREVGE